MIVTIEISIYPLQDNYGDIILQFIKRLKSLENISVETNSMSTYIQGEWDRVMQVLTVELTPIFQELDMSSTIIKIVNRKIPLKNGYYKIDDNETNK